MTMLIRTNVQIDARDYELIKEIHKDLHYKSISEYFREAVTIKIREDQRQLRMKKRELAMEAIGRNQYENIFEAIEGEDFENR
jgi:hypothetical protein